ncbi:MAG: radical SAM protein [Bacteroidota bacterium]
MNYRAFLNTVGTRAHSLPIVILYVTAGCNLRCMTCSYRDPLPSEMTVDEYKELFKHLQQMGLRRVVYSGGEPLMRKDFLEICRIAERTGVRQTLLTNGLLLEKRAKEILPFFEEVIISLDGPDAMTHNSIRGLECFDQIVRGIEAMVGNTNKPSLSVRFVVQRRNFRKLDEMVVFAKGLGIDRLSFLAADVQSDAFHRDRVGPVAPSVDILLDPEECAVFRESVKDLLQKRKSEFLTHFIAETPGKMIHLVEYFEAHQGISPFPRNECNAPSVSLVISSTGDVLPCYFLPSFGNVRSRPLPDLLNTPEIRETRTDVRAYRLKECHQCVCTLKIHPFNALLDAF